MSDLSICWMVIDGGSLFAQSLESVKGFDAQLCVLIDSRTTDNTEELAKAAGAEVSFHDWPDDFAEARNLSMASAKRKWTLIIDHDERFEPADISRLIEILEAEEDIFHVNHAIVGYHLTRKWCLPDSIVNAVANHHNIHELSKDETLSNIIKLGVLFFCAASF